MYNVLEAREVVPYFLEWGFDSETIAELDHDKGIYFYKTQKSKNIIKKRTERQQKTSNFEIKQLYFLMT